MKLFEVFSEPGYHTTLITTFGVDFAAYESIVLQRLRSSGCSNNLLIVDRGMLTLALDTTAVLPAHAGRRYTVSGASANGVFHPKIILQLGRKTARLLVTSANMTASGMAGNLEVVGEIRAGVDSMENAPTIVAALSFFEKQLDPSQKVQQDQIGWAVNRTPWIRGVLPSSETLVLDSGELGAFLATGQKNGIGQRFVELVGKVQVSRLLVISPYWDPGLQALRYLDSALKPKSIDLLIQPSQQLFPSSAIGRMSHVRVYDIDEIGKAATGRFVHAKVIIAQTAEADYVLFGSANCTVAALGSASSSGTNEEACIYRKTAPGRSIADLGLKNALKATARIKAEALPDYVLVQNIRLEDAELKDPGTFELRYEVLSWWPSKSYLQSEVKIDFFDVGLSSVEASISRIDGFENPIRFELESDVRPSFAQVRVSDSVSALSIITLAESVKETQREASTRKVDAALQELYERPEEGLWLLEVLDTLEAAEVEDQRQLEQEYTARKGARYKDVKQTTSKTLSYEKFIAGRQPLREGKRIERNSLGASHLDSVRAFLNHVVAGVPLKRAELDSDNDAAIKALSMGEDTAGDEGDDRLSSPPSLTKPGREQKRRHAEYVIATQRHIADAVWRFIDHIKEKCKTSHLSVRDMLKLRALIVVVAAAGSNKSELEVTKYAKDGSSLQVLSIDGLEGWPTLLGRLLFAFFQTTSTGTMPFVLQLQIDSEFDQIPDDVLECWATCYWAAAVRRTAFDSKGVLVDAGRNANKLAAEVYRLTGLSATELNQEQVTHILRGLSQRFCARLGSSPESVLELHGRTGSPRI